MSQRNRLPNAPLGAGLIVALSLAAVALANYERKADNNYQSARQEYEKFKRVVTAETAADSKHTGDKSYREEWRAEQNLDAQRNMSDWSYFTMLATWFGVVLLGATLWEATRTTQAAADAAEAAKDSVRVAYKTSERQLRAYVGVEKAVVHEWSREGCIFRIAINNFGQTPAYGLKAWGRTVFGPYPIRHDFPTERPLDVQDRVMILDPGSGFTIAVKTMDPLSEADWQKAVARECRVFVYCEVTYEDAFHKDRSRKFRMMFGGQLVPGANNMVWCETGNEGD